MRSEDNILVMATAGFDTASDIISHVKFINPGSAIHVLSKDEDALHFSRLENADHVFNSTLKKKIDPRKLPKALIRKLEAISFKKTFVCSEYNTDNIIHYKQLLMFSETLCDGPIYVINHNLRTFKYEKGLFEYRPVCNVCKSRMVFYRKTTFPSSLEPVSLFECESCGFISQDFDLLDKNELRESYKYLVIPWMNHFGKMVDKLHGNNLKYLLRHVSPLSVCIDMGCGSGGLEYYARREGENVKILSFDLNMEAIGWAGQYGITIYPVDITETDEVRKTLHALGFEHVDCIYCNNSLEHIYKPYEVLTAWAGLLRNGGYFHITIPIIDFVYDDYRAFERNHLSYFFVDTFMNMIGRIGLEVTEYKAYDIDNSSGSGYAEFMIRKP